MTVVEVTRTTVAITLGNEIHLKVHRIQTITISQIL